MFAHLVQNWPAYKKYNELAKLEKKRDQLTMLPEQLRAFYEDRISKVARVLSIKFALLLAEVEEIFCNFNLHLLIAIYVLF